MDRRKFLKLGIGAAALGAAGIAGVRLLPNKVGSLERELTVNDLIEFPDRYEGKRVTVTGYPFYEKSSSYGKQPYDEFLLEKEPLGEGLRLIDLNIGKIPRSDANNPITITAYWYQTGNGRIPHEEELGFRDGTYYLWRPFDSDL